MIDNTYLDLVGEVLNTGTKRQTRNAETLSTFGMMLKVDELLRNDFPILTSRKMYPKGIFGELAAFLNEPKSVVDFKNQGCNYWDAWGDDSGRLNVDYGNAWKSWPGKHGTTIDQQQKLIEGLINDPMGRRHIITGWNPTNLDDLSLPCCHLLYQWYVRDGGVKGAQYLDMIWYQRSVDMMVGLPSDIVLAAAWNVALAHEVGMYPGTITFMLGDCHIYDQHIEKAVDLVWHSDRTTFTSTSYTYDPAPINKFNKDSIELLNYTPNDPIKFELIV